VLVLINFTIRLQKAWIVEVLIILGCTIYRGCYEFLEFRFGKKCYEVYQCNHRPVVIHLNIKQQPNPGWSTRDDPHTCRGICLRCSMLARGKA
jgi:hypothetical protein